MRSLRCEHRTLWACDDSAGPVCQTSLVCVRACLSVCVRVCVGALLLAVCRRRSVRSSRAARACWQSSDVAGQRRTHARTHGLTGRPRESEGPAQKTVMGRSVTRAKKSCPRRSTRAKKRGKFGGGRAKRRAGRRGDGLAWRRGHGTAPLRTGAGTVLIAIKQPGNTGTHHSPTCVQLTAARGWRCSLRVVVASLDDLVETRVRGVSAPQHGRRRSHRGRDSGGDVAQTPSTWTRPAPLCPIVQCAVLIVNSAILMMDSANLMLEWDHIHSTCVTTKSWEFGGGEPERQKLER